MEMDLAAGDPGRAAAGAGGSPHSAAEFTVAALTQHTAPTWLRSLTHALQMQNSPLLSSSATSRAASKHAVPLLCYSWPIQLTVSSGQEHFAAEDRGCPVLLHFAAKPIPFPCREQPALQSCWRVQPLECVGHKPGVRSYSSSCRKEAEDEG